MLYARVYDFSSWLAVGFSYSIFFARISFPCRIFAMLCINRRDVQGEIFDFYCSCHNRDYGLNCHFWTSYLEISFVYFQDFAFHCFHPLSTPIKTFSPQTILDAHDN